jgi:hypothetical protein
MINILSIIQQGFKVFNKYKENYKAALDVFGVLGFLLFFITALQMLFYVSIQVAAIVIFIPIPEFIELLREEVYRMIPKEYLEIEMINFDFFVFLKVIFSFIQLILGAFIARFILRRTIGVLILRWMNSKSNEEFFDEKFLAMTI